MGEGDYERYCEHMRTRHPGVRVPTQKEFYLSRLNERYSHPSRWLATQQRDRFHGIGLWPKTTAFEQRFDAAGDALASSVLLGGGAG
jgi:hypothetical protein